MDYFPRQAVDLILSKIKHDPVIVLTGSRQTGKTTLCDSLLPGRMKLPHTYITFDDPDERLRFQSAGIGALESITTPLVVIDEAQKMPSLFDPLKYVVDKQRRTKNAPRQVFLLTGSSQMVLLKKITESLAGRAALVNLFPLSLSEVLRRETAPFLSKIWQAGRITKKDVDSVSALSPERVRAAVHARNEHQAWGGYPAVWQRSEKAAKLSWLKDYRKTYVERDISDVGQVANIDTFAMAQKLLCARTAQLLSISEVARDLSLAVNTVKRYVSLLSMTFQCHLVRPYHENIGKRFVKSPKIYFPDPGVNRAILGDVGTGVGAAYESWVFSETLKWSHIQSIEPELYFYRTSGGMEVDFLLSGEGRMLPIEVKASQKVTPADGRHVETFLLEHRKTSPLGLVVYPGPALIEIRKNVWAIPDWLLFSGLQE